MSKIHPKTQEKEDNSFNQEICELKHLEINRHFEDIKEIILAAIKNVEEKIDKDISYKEENLKNKIIVVEKGINEKIDIIDEFQDTIKGNGEPGISERMRSVELKVKYNFYTIVIIIILLFGGEFWGVTAENIKKYFSHTTTPIKEVQKENGGENKSAIVDLPK